jgi:hypothetical protein
MDLDNLVIPDGKKALFVIHEENMREEENPDEWEKCKYLETAEHRRVLESDIKILEQYPVITISREEKKLGIYVGEKEKIPDDANALIVVGETKNFHKYVAKYCNLKDNVGGEVKEKGKSIFDFLHFSFPSPYSLFTIHD